MESRNIDAGCVMVHLSVNMGDTSSHAKYAREVLIASIINLVNTARFVEGFQFAYMASKSASVVFVEAFHFASMGN